MKTSEVLFSAIDLLRERGWIQGAYENRKGFCMSRAIIEVCGLDYVLANHLIYAMNCNMFSACSIINFNDNHCESIDDACAALEIAACCSAAEGD